MTYKIKFFHSKNALKSKWTHHTWNWKLHPPCQLPTISMVTRHPFKLLTCSAEGLSFHKVWFLQATSHENINEHHLPGFRTRLHLNGNKFARSFCSGNRELVADGVLSGRVSSANEFVSPLILCLNFNSEKGRWSLVILLLKLKVFF